MVTEPESSEDKSSPFDPDEFRMTIGEHLEELRKRLIYGLGGFAIVLIVMMLPPVGERVFMIFCAPLSKALEEHHLPPQLHSIGISDGFMTYLQICIVCALVVAGPWLIYQLWLFIAAGLYPSERKTITKYIPLSIGLLLTGVLFVYFAVLPMTMNFFLTFNGEIPLPPSVGGVHIVDNPKVQLIFPLLEGDPKEPADGSAWYNTRQSRIKIKLGKEIQTLAVTSSSLIATTPSVDEYIDFVFMFMLIFAVAFQLPLVQLALVRVGIVEISFLRKQRRLVYFVMAIAAGIFAPGDLVTSMVALLGPMLILYEFGIMLAVYGERKRARERAAEGLE